MIKHTIHHTLTSTCNECLISKFLKRQTKVQALTGKSLMNDNKFLQTGNRINMQLKFNIAAEPRASGKPVYNKNLFI